MRLTYRNFRVHQRLYEFTGSTDSRQVGEPLQGAEIKIVIELKYYDRQTEHIEVDDSRGSTADNRHVVVLNQLTDWLLANLDLQAFHGYGIEDTVWVCLDLNLCTRRKVW